MHTEYFRKERLRKKRLPLYHIPCEHWPVLLIIISLDRAKLCLKEGKVSLAVIEKKSILCQWFFHSLHCTMVTLSQNQHSQSAQKTTKKYLLFSKPELQRNHYAIVLWDLWTICHRQHCWNILFHLLTMLGWPLTGLNEPQLIMLNSLQKFSVFSKYSTNF